jgi:cytochrome c2
MPRLDLDEAKARDIAAYLSPAEDEPATATTVALAGANAARGRGLMDVKGCGICHRMTGVAAIHPAMLPTGVTVSDMPRAVRLAPDLRFTRDRWRPSALVRWLVDPPKTKADTLMPAMGLTEDEAKAIAAYILQTPLGPSDTPSVPARLAVLDRKVTYDEVATRVFRKTCWHCHGEPDFERGDGGPGNSGGFGFKGRGLNLSDYQATFAGFLDDSGQRTSVFTPAPDGIPYVVAAMLARQKEEAGEDGSLRGMPLGLPALPPQDVQLVETWIAQGRPR